MPKLNCIFSSSCIWSSKVLCLYLSTGSSAPPCSSWDFLHCKGYHGPPSLWLCMWERGKPSVCGHQNCSVCKYSYPKIGIPYAICPKLYFKTVSILCTTVLLLLWQLPLLYKDSISVSVLFVSAAVLCCCIALVCSAALLLRLLNRFPYRVEEYLLPSLSLPIHRSLTVNYKWPNKHIKIKEWQHVHVLVLLPGWKLFLLTPAIQLWLSYSFFHPHVVVSCCFSPSLFFLPFSALKFCGSIVVLRTNTIVLLAVSSNFGQHVTDFILFYLFYFTII